MRRALRAALFGALTGLATIAVAQTTDPAPPVFDETPATRAKAYADEARNLALVLGASHYMRVLCAGRVDQSWREFMRGLLDRERAVRRSILIDAFNEGYRDAEARFSACGASAQQEEAALKAQGLRLAETLAARNED